MNPDHIRGRILASMADCPDGWEPSAKEKGAILGQIHKAIDPHQQHRSFQPVWRHILLAWLFGGQTAYRPSVLSSKSLKSRQWYALYRWIDWYRDENMIWQVSQEFLTEAALCLAQAQKESAERERQLLQELGYG